MLIFSLWGRLRSVSTLTSPSWIVRNKHLRETGTVLWLLTRHLSSVCVTIIHQFITHLFNKHTHTQGEKRARSLFTTQLYCNLAHTHTLSIILFISGFSSCHNDFTLHYQCSVKVFGLL